MNKIKIKLIIFDAAGVTWKGGYHYASRYLSRKYNIPYKRVIDVINGWFLKACAGKMSGIDAFQKSADELGLSLSGKKIELLYLNLHQERKIMLNFSQYLRQQGYKTVILTNNFSAYVKKFKIKFKLDKYFDGIINSQDLGLKKSDSKMFRYVLKKYQVKPSEVLYFDDLSENLIVPKKIGINVILFRNVKQIKKEVLDFLKLYDKT